MPLYLKMSQNINKTTRHLKFCECVCVCVFVVKVAFNCIAALEGWN